MFRHSIASLIVALAAGGSALAADDTVRLGRYQPAAGGFGGAVASAADSAVANDDTVLVHGRRYRGFYGGYFGGYRGFSIGFSSGYPWGWGWPGYGYGYRGIYGWPGYGYGYGYRGLYGWPGYGYGYRGFYGYPWYYGGYSYGFYRPGFAISVYSAPRFYSPFAYPLPYYSYAYSAYGLGGYLPIGGSSAPTVALSLPARPAVPLTDPPGETLRYDGGPTNPVPLPAPDGQETPQRIEPARESDSLPISLKKPAAPPASYKYPAYGERK